MSSSEPIVGTSVNSFDASVNSAPPTVVQPTTDTATKDSTIPLNPSQPVAEMKATTTAASSLVTENSGVAASLTPLIDSAGVAPTTPTPINMNEHLTHSNDHTTISSMEGSTSLAHPTPLIIPTTNMTPITPISPTAAAHTSAFTIPLSPRSQPAPLSPSSGGLVRASSRTYSLSRRPGSMIEAAPIPINTTTEQSPLPSTDGTTATATAIQSALIEPTASARSSMTLQPLQVGEDEDTVAELPNRAPSVSETDSGNTQPLFRSGTIQLQSHFRVGSDSPMGAPPTLHNADTVKLSTENASPHAFSVPATRPAMHHKSATLNMSVSGEQAFTPVGLPSPPIFPPPILAKADTLNFQTDLASPKILSMGPTPADNTQPQPNSFAASAVQFSQVQPPQHQQPEPVLSAVPTTATIDDNSVIVSVSTSSNPSITSASYAPDAAASSGPNFSFTSVTKVPSTTNSNSLPAVQQLVSELASIDDDSATQPTYKKSLQSDLSTAESLQLFQQVQKISDFFKDFTESELKIMSEVFSVLKVPADEKIISKGEEATFCGVILSGSFNALTSSGPVELHTGNLLGEMAIFESMSRSADIVSREASVLAVLTFQELDSLATSGEMSYMLLQMKLLKMFASASLRKLRKTTEQIEKSLVEQKSVVSFSESFPKDSQRNSLVKDATLVVPPHVDEQLQQQQQQENKLLLPKSKRASGKLSPTRSLSSHNSMIASQTNTGGKSESLYRVRLALEKDKDAAQKQAEEERAARLKVEKKNQNVAASLERYKNLSNKFKDALEKSTERCDAQAKEMDELKKQFDTAQTELRLYHADHESLAQQLTREVAARELLDRQLAEARDAATQAQAIVRGEQRAEMTQLLGRTVDLEMEIARLSQELAQAKQINSERSAAGDASTQELKQRVQSLQLEMEDVLTAKRASDEQAKHQMGLNSQLSLQLTHIKHQVKENEEKLQANVNWKQKAQDLELALSQEKKQGLSTTTSLVAQNGVLRSDIQRYRKILQYVSVACFVKLFRLKKSTKHLHLQISELLVNILEGHVLATSAGAGLGASNLASDSSTAGNQLIIKSLQRKKRNYLDQVLRKTNGFSVENEPTGTPATGTRNTALFSSLPSPRNSSGAATHNIKLHELLVSLEDEVYKLKQPFDEVQERIQHWKHTSECFFSRNIELTSIILGYKEKLSQTELQNENLKTVLNKHNQEYESVLSVNTALKLEIARYKNEIQAYKVSNKSLEIASDIVGTRRSELENIESKIILQKAQLQYVQQRYIETVDALNTVIDRATSQPSSTPMMTSTSKRSLSPPRPGPPHFPPSISHPSTAAGTGAGRSYASSSSPSMTQLLQTTLGSTPGYFNRTGSAESFPISSSNQPGTASLSGSPSAASQLNPSLPMTPIPAAHEDPEKHFLGSLRLIQTTQEDLAREDYEKYKRVQFVLENQQAMEKNQNKNKRTSQSWVNDTDPLLAETMQEVEALHIRDHGYATVFDDKNYSLTDRDSHVDEQIAARNRSRAELEEESKTSITASSNIRVKQNMNGMTTRLLQNQPSTFLHQSNLVTTSETLSPGFSRTLMLMKKPTTAPTGDQQPHTLSSTTLPRLDGVRHDFPNVYAPHNSPPQTSRASYPLPVPSGGRYAIFSQQGLPLAAPSGYQHPVTAMYPSNAFPERNSFRSHGQYQSATSLQRPTGLVETTSPNSGPKSSPKKKQHQTPNKRQQSPDATSTMLTPLFPFQPSPLQLPFMTPSTSGAIGPLMMNNYATPMQQQPIYYQPQLQPLPVQPAHPSGAQTARD